MAMKTFQYRIYPTRSQERQCVLYLDATRNLYNMCLSERKLMWEHYQQSVSKTEQLRQVKHYKRTFPQMEAVHSHALQVAVSDLDKAFQAFFRRMKSGETPGYPRWYRDTQGKLRLKQRELARTQKGSKSRHKRINEVQRLHLKVKRQRKDYIDKIVDYLVKQYDLIAIEDLKPTNMVRNKHLSKSILDAGWGYFRERLNIKAVDAGCTVIAVNPAYTSQTCSACGCVNRENRPDQATFCCVECEYEDNADVNAAKNILNLALNGRDTSVLLNVAH